MKICFLFTILAVVFVACSPSAGQEKNGQNKKFQTTDPSRLYFKNMRSTYYDMEEQAVSRIELYRFRKFKPEPVTPLLYPVIANNWLEDEAYLFVEAAGYEKGYSKPITVQWEGDGQQGSLQLEPPTADRQYAFAMDIYQHLLDGHKLWALDSLGTPRQLLERQDARTHYITTVRDYLRLTEAR